jgi:hypothetical protein
MGFNYTILHNRALLSPFSCVLHLTKPLELVVRLAVVPCLLRAVLGVSVLLFRDHPRQVKI